MTVLMVIQARMNSSRLPGKVLKCVNGKPLLAYQVERLLRVKNIDKLVIATTKHSNDDPIVELCKENGITCFRGDENDVLFRYYEVAKAQSAQTIVRITGDCPLIDPNIVGEVIERYLDERPKYDYVSNIQKRSFPRGMDTEIFSMEVLEKTHQTASSKYDREHVTPYMYHEHSSFSIDNVSAEENYSHFRWTLDTQEDFQFIKKIIEILYPSCKTFTMKDILDLLEKRPELKEINEHVKQKEH
jgi:spore coat polysaccharide biosynthesis protein SpsF